AEHLAGAGGAVRGGAVVGRGARGAEGGLRLLVARPEPAADRPQPHARRGAGVGRRGRETGPAAGVRRRRAVPGGTGRAAWAGAAAVRAAEGSRERGGYLLTGTGAGADGAGTSTASGGAGVSKLAGRTGLGLPREAGCGLPRLAPEGRAGAGGAASGG